MGRVAVFTLVLVMLPPSIRAASEDYDREEWLTRLINNQRLRSFDGVELDTLTNDLKGKVAIPCAYIDETLGKTVLQKINLFLEAQKKVKEIKRADIDRLLDDVTKDVSEFFRRHPRLPDPE